MKKTKLTLQNLKVNSFQTTGKAKLKGGCDTLNPDLLETNYPCESVDQCTCTINYTRCETTELGFWP